MGGGLDPQETGQTFVRSLVWTNRQTENSPLCSIKHRPLRVRCPKRKQDSIKERKIRDVKSEKVARQLPLYIIMTSIYILL